jgi:hypothetical protein
MHRLKKLSLDNAFVLIDGQTGFPAVICSLVPYVPFGSRANESEVAPDS